MSSVDCLVAMVVTSVNSLNTYHMSVGGADVTIQASEAVYVSYGVETTCASTSFELKNADTTAYTNGNVMINSASGLL